MIKILLNPLIYFLPGLALLIVFSVTHPYYLWIGVLLILCSIPAWFARKTWLSIRATQATALILEEDFVP
jgi:hypothetical protein